MPNSTEKKDGFEKLMDVIDSVTLSEITTIENGYRGTTSTYHSFRARDLLRQAHTASMVEMIEKFAEHLIEDVDNGIAYNKQNYDKEEITEVQIKAYIRFWVQTLKDQLKEDK